MDFLTKLKTFVHQKNTTKKVKRQSTELEKTSANNVFDRDSYTDCKKKSYNSTIKRQIIQLKNGQKP